jgi:hypothetical protein
MTTYFPTPSIGFPPGYFDNYFSQLGTAARVDFGNGLINMGNWAGPLVGGPLGDVIRDSLVWSGQCFVDGAAVPLPPGLTWGALFAAGIQGFETAAIASAAGAVAAWAAGALLAVAPVGIALPVAIGIGAIGVLLTHREWGTAIAWMGQRLGQSGLVSALKIALGDATDLYYKHLYDTKDAFDSLLRAVFKDPLILDLDGDGVEVSALAGSSVHFDFDGDGFAERTGWVGADDGILVIDDNENGQVDGAAELFGSPTQDGFEVLETLDTNGDGRIDSLDEEFGKLRVWQDLDGDGVTDVGECTLSRRLELSPSRLRGRR